MATALLDLQPVTELPNWLSDVLLKLCADANDEVACKALTTTEHPHIESLLTAAPFIRAFGK